MQQTVVIRSSGYEATKDQAKALIQGRKEWDKAAKAKPVKHHLTAVGFYLKVYAALCRKGQHGAAKLQLGSLAYWFETRGY